MCGCDDTCLYIGDCCYDFFYLCKGEFNLDDALMKQLEIMKNFVDKTVCTKHYIQTTAELNEYLVIKIPMIAKCPPNTTDNLLALCVDYQNNILSVLPPIPIIHHGILYSNIYCSFCNGVPLEEATLLQHKIIDLNDIYTESPTLAGRTKGKKKREYEVVVLNDIFSIRHRFIAACDSRCLGYESHCPLEQRAKECRAYKAPFQVVSPDGARVYFNNMACLNCTNKYLVEIRCPIARSLCGVEQTCTWFQNKWISLFDFVGTNEHVPHEEAVPNCASIRCQQGYILREHGCSYCMNDDTHSSPTSLSWFQPTVLLIFRAENSVETLKQIYGRDIIRNDPNCTHTIYWFRGTGLFDISTHYIDYKNVCFLLSISYVEVQFYMNILRSETVMEQIMPGLRSSLHAALITNFDVRFKADCESVTVSSTSFDDISQGTYINSTSKLRNLSNSQHVPWVFARSFTVSNGQVKAWNLLCLEKQSDEFNCSHKNASDLETCPKIEFQFISKSGNVFVTKHGLILKQRPDEFILINNHTALVCADQCGNFKFNFPNILDILVPICYSVSMICLLATFLIYAVVPAMRNVPGLMLMNLIMALFLAQVSYLISSQGVFLNQPSRCQFLGAAQHHLWLTAFAWMVSISVDIFQCLDSLQVSRAESHRKRYYKLVALCWIAPAIIPVVTICLQFSGWVNVGYGGKQTCWLINSRSVLYLFAIPALSIVCLNSILFLGCVYRIRQMSNNADLVGRKEDSKQRMLQCFKISSWIGTSWLFGILPNVINCPQLWYIFTICNAFQGVHILVGFGLSQRSRQLLCGATGDKIPDAAFTATPKTTAVNRNSDSPAATWWVFLYISPIQTMMERSYIPSLIARFMGSTWGPPGADRTLVGPMLAPWTLLSGLMVECVTL